MALSDDLDDLRDQLESRPPMVKYGDKPGLTIPNPDMNNNLDTVVVGGDVSIEAARIAIIAGEDAFASRQSAEQSATIAADAAVAAVDAKNTVVAAEIVVADAKNEAVQANDDAQAAKNTTVSARDEVVAARDVLVPAIDETLEARDLAVDASNSATNAANVATTKAGEANQSALDAKRWADAAEISAGIADLGMQIATLPRVKPILNFDFVNSRYVDPRITFTRATPDWDWEGNEYGINEPVLSEEGLWLWGSRTNLFPYSSTSPLSGSGIATMGVVSREDSDGIFEKEIVISLPTSETNRFSYYLYIPNLEIGETYTFTARVSVEGGGKPEIDHAVTGNGDFSFMLDNNIATQDKYTIKHISGDEWRLFGAFTHRAGNRVGIIKYDENSSKRVTVRGFQIEKGEVSTPTIPTNGSQVTVAASTLEVKGDAFSGVFNRNVGAMILNVGANNLMEASLEDRFVNFGLLGPLAAHLSGSLAVSDRRVILRGPSGAFKPSGNRPMKTPISGLPLGFKIAISYGIDTNVVVNADGGITFPDDMIDFLQIAASRIYVHPNTQGYVRSLSYYDRALTDEQLQELTA